MKLHPDNNRDYNIYLQDSWSEILPVPFLVGTGCRINSYLKDYSILKEFYLFVIFYRALNNGNLLCFKIVDFLDNFSNIST